MADARRHLLSVLRTMRLTGRNPTFGGAIGAPLAARLDRLIVALRGKPEGEGHHLGRGGPAHG